ncbi:MAG TPA: hypothetical protein VFP91_02905, partial [Vicinamibacterales bacterium]|nr:hypothetical protein [Vicinamibacterales bacterium]
VGQATASSVEDAKEASYKNAIDNAVRSIATAAPVDFFAYMKAISSVADTYLSYDPKTFMVTFWTLLRAPKDLVSKQTVEQLANYEDYIAAFRRGVKASQARDWASSIQAMQTAIRQQPKTQLVKQVSIQGVRSEPYAPHYFLGIGLTELHECAAAADAFARAEVEVKGTPLVGPLQAQKGRCPAQ